MANRIRYVPSARVASEFAAQIREEAESTAQEVKALYAGITEGWKHSIDFQTDNVQGGDDLILNTHASGDDARIFRYVDEGTSVRYATMTDDFEAKTQRRLLGSSSGRGGVKFVDRRMPWPGIQAREFSKEIAERLQPKFIAKIRTILNG